MGSFAVGRVVLVAFPYADFSRFKKRPAVVVGQADFDNLILCQITSKAETSQRAIALSDADFEKGGLKIKSFIRPDKLFTIEPGVVEADVGQLSKKKTADVRVAVRNLFS